MQLIVTRRFPTYDFVVRTDSSRTEVIEAMTAAMTEPIHTTVPERWTPYLEGSVDGGVITCQRRITGRWYNGIEDKTVPKVSAEIIPRDGGGTDILARVDQSWHIPGPALGIILGAVFLANGGGLPALAFITIVFGLALSRYFEEAQFIVRIFQRILGSITSSHPPAP